MKYPNRNKVYIEKTKLTKKLADYLLSRNTSNRKMKMGWVAQLADMMLGGQWKPHCDNIMINSDGTLIDGQHRLRAFLEAYDTNPKIDIWIDVKYNVPNDTAAELNTGVKRTIGDHLGVAGLPDGPTIASAITMIWRYDVFGPEGLGMRSKFTTPSVQTTIKLVEDNPNIYEIKNKVTVAKDMIPVSVATALAVLFCRAADVEFVYDFFNRVGTGEDIKAGYPSFALRKKVIQEMLRPNRRVSRKELVAWTVLAWNKYIKDKKMIKIQWVKKEIPDIESL